MPPASNRKLTVFIWRQFGNFNCQMAIGSRALRHRMVSANGWNYSTWLGFGPRCQARDTRPALVSGQSMSTTALHSTERAFARFPGRAGQYAWPARCPAAPDGPWPEIDPEVAQSGRGQPRCTRPSTWEDLARQARALRRDYARLARTRRPCPACAEWDQGYEGEASTRSARSGSR